MPSSDVSLALFVPLIAKADKIDDVTAFLKTGCEMVVNGEPDTIQWFGLKYEGSDTLSPSLDTFRTEAAAALGANAPTLLASGPEIAQTIILANKVDASKGKGVKVGLRVFVTPKPDKAEEFTPVWYALEFPGPQPKFAILDLFEDDAGREKHLAGKVAEALFANAESLLASAPDVVKVNVVVASVKV
ncbi:hypothetical protein C8F01DRAFT_1247540 [Mycena amicta]|nr:hypothetical protein C8F01DRAFT_1247540 [Mycena amicta]